MGVLGASKCPLCQSHWHSTFSLRHYTTCKFLKILGNKYLELPQTNRAEHFLICVNEHPFVVISRIIHLFAIKSAHDKCRHNAYTQADFERAYRATLISLVASSQCAKYLDKSLLFGSAARSAEVVDSV